MSPTISAGRASVVASRPHHREGHIAKTVGTRHEIQKSVITAQFCFFFRFHVHMAIWLWRREEGPDLLGEGEPTNRAIFLRACVKLNWRGFDLEVVLVKYSGLICVMW